MIDIETLDIVIRVCREIKKARRSYDKVSLRRFEAGPGISRTKVTTMNASLAINAEEVHRREQKLKYLTNNI